MDSFRLALSVISLSFSLFTLVCIVGDTRGVKWMDEASINDGTTKCFFYYDLETASQYKWCEDRGGEE